MKHYIDVRIKPDAEMRQNILLNTVYTKLHKALFEDNSNTIGISFPEYKILLGNIIRLHSSNTELESIIETNWLGGLAGYCTVSEILAVPEDAKYRIVSRWQSNMSESGLRRLIKRAEKRGEAFNGEQIKNYRVKMYKEQLTERPYLELQSGSNGHRHRRYIQFGELVDKPVQGKFDTFGLSKTATIPWF